MRHVLHLLLFLQIFSQQAVNSHYLKMENDDQTSSSIGDVFRPTMCTRFRPRRDTENNTVLVFLTQIEPLARIANSFHLSSYLANSANDKEIVLNELINIADSSVVKSLGTLNMDTVIGIVENLNTLPLVLSDDRAGVVAGLNSLVDINARYSELQALVEDQVLLDFTNKLTNVLPNDVKVLNSYDGTQIVTHLNHIVKPNLDAGTLDILLPMVVKGLTALEESTHMVESLDLSAFDDIVSGLELVQNVKDWSAFFNFYQSQKNHLDILSASLVSISKDVRNIQDFAKSHSSNESVAKIIDEFKDFIWKLKSSTSPSSRIHTPALPRGVHDLNHISSDVQNPWIQKTFGTKKINILKAALEPLAKIIFHISQFEAELHTVAARGLVLQNVDSIAQMVSDMLDLKQNPKKLDDSKRDVEMAVSYLSDVGSVDTKQLESGHAKLKNLGNLLSQLKEIVSELVADSDFQSLKDFSVLKSALTFPANIDEKSLQFAMKSLKDGGKLDETIQKIGKIDPIISKFKVMIQTVADTLVPLSTFENTIQSVNKKCHDSHKSLENLLRLLHNNDVFEPIRGGFQFASNVHKWSVDRSFFKETMDIVSDVLSSINSLENVRNRMTLSEMTKKRPEMQKIMNFKNGLKVSKVLGVGSLLVEELGKALEKRTDLQMVATNSELIGMEIQNVKDQKMKIDIEKGWKQSTDIKTSLETLVDFVDKLSKEIPKTGAASVTDIGQFLEKVKNVKDPKISVKDLQKAVGLLHVAISNPNVTKTNRALFQITDLDLNFAARASAVTDISTSIGDLNKFLDDLFTIAEPSPPSSGNNTSSDPSDSSTPATPIGTKEDKYLWYKISSGFSVAIIVVLLPIHFFLPCCLSERRKKKEKDLEKMEGSKQTKPTASQTQPPNSPSITVLPESTVATPYLTGKIPVDGSPPSVKVNKKLKDQLMETQNNLARLRAHVKKSNAQHKSDTRSNKFKKKGPIFIPMKPDVPPGATNLPDNIILENVIYDPSGNEQYDIGSAEDDVEMDTSLTLDAPTSRESIADNTQPENSKTPNASKKKVKSKGRKSSGKSKKSGK